MHILFIALLILLPPITLFYLLYRLFFSPTYLPGSIASESLKNPLTFDPPHLYPLSTPTTFHMPPSIKIHYETLPSLSSDRTHILCIHGGPAIPPQTFWKTCHDHSLREKLSFHFYHQRGCGKSTKPFDKYPSKRFFPGCLELEQRLGLGAQIADIERIRRRLGVEKIGLMGHSFGGFVATLYAAEFPRHVASLVLLTPASMLKMPPVRFDMFKAIRERLRTEEERVRFDDFRQRFLGFGKFPELDEEGATRLQMEFGEMFQIACPDMFVGDKVERENVGGWAAIASYLSLGIRYDYRATLRKRLNKVNFKTVIVNGSEDIQPVEEGRAYATLFPENKVECRVVKAGHFLQDEHPSEVAQVVRDVLMSSPTEG